MAARDLRDLVIEGFAVDEGDLLDRVVDLVIERDAYRLLAQQAIHYAAEVVRERDRLRHRHHRTLDLLREQRSRLPKEQAA